ncbi:MAG TPA: hypothetical protein VHM16_02785 [Rubrobacteraceae bacterium]|nr:hypothetical protein [Rubrobacteraceae bacterium]
MDEAMLVLAGSLVQLGAEPEVVPLASPETVFVREVDCPDVRSAVLDVWDVSEQDAARRSKIRTGTRVRRMSGLVSREGLAAVVARRDRWVVLAHRIPILK